MDFPHRSPMAARGADISEDCRRDLGKSVRQLRKKNLGKSVGQIFRIHWMILMYTFLKKMFKNKILILHICSYMLIFNIRCILMNYMIRCDFRTWKIWRLQWTLKQKVWWNGDVTIGDQDPDVNLPRHRSPSFAALPLISTVMCFTLGSWRWGRWWLGIVMGYGRMAPCQRPPQQCLGLYGWWFGGIGHQQPHISGRISNMFLGGKVTALGVESSWGNYPRMTYGFFSQFCTLGTSGNFSHDPKNVSLEYNIYIYTNMYPISLYYY